MKQISGLVAAMALAFLLSSCKGSSSAAGVTTPSTNSSGGSSGTISGTVMGGLSPIKNANIQLFQAGNSSPVSSAVTSTNGTFAIPGTLSSGLYYVLVTNGNAGSGTNSNIQLIALVGAGTNLSSSNVTVNEMTTAAAGTILYNFGLLTSTGRVNAPANNTSASNAMAQYNNLVTVGGAINTSTGLGTTTTNALNTLANALASCVETAGSCSGYFNAAVNGSATGASSMMQAMYNTLNTSSSQTNIYNVAFPLAASTGFSMSSSTIPGGFTFNNVLPVTTNTFSIGSATQQLAVDVSGNIWVTTHGASNNVLQLSPTGVTLGTFSTPNHARGIAIDASGNLWVCNDNAATLTEFNSSGTLLQNISINDFGGGINSVAIDNAGNIWIATNEPANLNNIQKLNSSGTVLYLSTTADSSNWVAIDAAGNAWVAVVGGAGSNVTEFNSAVTLLGTVALSDPTGLAIDQNGNVWVANFNAQNVVELSSSRTTLGTFSPNLGGFSRPQYVTIDTSGNVWVTFGGGGISKLVEYNSSGAVSAKYAVGTSPSGLVVDPSGNVWVANSGSNNVSEVTAVTNGPQFFPYSGPIWP